MIVIMPSTLRPSLSYFSTTVWLILDFHKVKFIYMSVSQLHLSISKNCTGYTFLFQSYPVHPSSPVDAQRWYDFTSKPSLTHMEVHPFFWGRDYYKKTHSSHTVNTLLFFSFMGGKYYTLMKIFCEWGCCPSICRSGIHSLLIWQCHTTECRGTPQISVENIQHVASLWWIDFVSTLSNSRSSRDPETHNYMLIIEIKQF